jgi:hypothetical protein
MKGLSRQIIVLLSSIFMIVALSVVSTANPDFEGSGPEAGSTAVYDLFPTAVSPVPFTFTIWAFIFLGAIVFGVYQAFPENRKDARLDKLALPLTAAYFFNAATGFAPSIGWGVAAVVALLISLIVAFTILVSFGKLDRRFTWFVRVPTVLFFGWITVATIVSTSQWLVSLQWQGFGVAPTLWGGLLILVATSIGVFIVQRYAAITYGGVLIWAFWGIVVVNPSAIPVLISTLVATLVLGWCIVTQLRKPPQQRMMVAQ